MSARHFDFTVDCDESKAGIAETFGSSPAEMDRALRAIRDDSSGSITESLVNTYESGQLQGAHILALASAAVLVFLTGRL